MRPVPHSLPPFSSAKVSDASCRLTELKLPAHGVSFTVDWLLAGILTQLVTRVRTEESMGFSFGLFSLVLLGKPVILITTSQHQSSRSSILQGTCTVIQAAITSVARYTCSGFHLPRAR